MPNLINPVAKSLATIIENKKTRLCVAADVTTKAELLRLANLLGPYICIFKTHIDMIDDFDWGLIEQLKRLARKHNFLLFEDRKFADIGNTVKQQYSGGLYRIADWADISNCHLLAGEGCVAALAEIAGNHNKALLLIAELSSQGNLCDTRFIESAKQLSRKYQDTVIGFICQHKLCESNHFFHLSPGTSLQAKTDNLGQQYTAPKTKLNQHGIDILIVGRDIIQHHSPTDRAKEYLQLVA